MQRLQRNRCGVVRHSGVQQQSEVVQRCEAVQHRAMQSTGVQRNQPFSGEPLLPLRPVTRPDPPSPERVLAVGLAHHRGTSTLCVPQKYHPPKVLMRKGLLPEYEGIYTPR